MVSYAVRRLLVALPVVLVVGACGAEAGPTADGPATVTTSTETATSTETTTTAPTTTTTTAAPFTAADGRNLEACADGTCEVFVQTGDMLPNASGAGPAQITVEGSTVSISHGAESGMASTLSGSAGMPQQINGQVFLIVAVQNGQGVLRLSMA